MPEDPNQSTQPSVIHVQQDRLQRSPERYPRLADTNGVDKSSAQRCLWSQLGVMDLMPRPLA